VARRSGGHLRDAESLLGQILSLGDKKITSEQAELVLPHYNTFEAIDLIGQLGRKEAVKAVTLINKLADSGVNMKIFVSELIGLLRQIILDKLSPELAGNLGLDLGENLEKNLNQAAENLEWSQLLSFSQKFIEVFNNNKTAVVPQLPLELAVVELCLVPPKPFSVSDNPASEAPRPNVSRSTSAPIKNSPATSSPVQRSVQPAVTKSQVMAESLIFSTPSTNFNSNSHQVIINLSAEEVGAKWAEFLVKIKKYNHSLSFVLQNCQPQEVRDNALCLVFKYKFHQDRINESAIKVLVEKTLAEVFGGALVIRSSIDENLDLKRDSETAVNSVVSASDSEKTKISGSSSTSAAPETKAVSGLMADLLKTFGGEVIN
jgi:DNA polymerase III gamma/tau subunit